MGASNSSTRLLASSAVYRLPSASIATPAGWHIPVALGAGLPGEELAQALSVKSVPSEPCPRTRSAVTLAVASGWLYSSTRLLVWSATIRSPGLSRLTPTGLQIPVALGAGPAELEHTAVVKLVPLAPWPKTRSAVVSPELPGVPGVPPPLASGLRYSRTRKLFESAANRSPSGSVVSPRGPHSESALITLAPLQSPVVKIPPCPNTLSATVSPELNSSTRLLCVSDTYRSPNASTATPSGKHIDEALIVSVPKLHPVVVKLPFCPHT